MVDFKVFLGINSFDRLRVFAHGRLQLSAFDEATQGVCICKSEIVETSTLRASR